MKIKDISSIMLVFISTIIAELLVILGAFFIVHACFLINRIIGNFALGTILIILGLFFAKTR